MYLLTISKIDYGRNSLLIIILTFVTIVNNFIKCTKWIHKKNILWKKIFEILFLHAPHTFKILSNTYTTYGV